jgi:hypothetical protein
MGKQRLRVFAIQPDCDCTLADCTAVPLQRLARLIGRQMAREYLNQSAIEKKHEVPPGHLPSETV